MSVTLFHHPHSRAATVVWMLEELGIDYTLSHVDLRAGAQRSAAFLAVNPMGKLPTLVDGPTVITEAAAIAMYLADRHALGRLAPALDDPQRATYLRWILYAPSVIEPGCMAHAGGWEVQASSAGWGRWDDMLQTIRSAIGEGPWLLGERFTMADVVFGGTVSWMVGFGLLPKDPAMVDYVARLGARPAKQRADAINAAELTKHAPPPAE